MFAKNEAYYIDSPVDHMNIYQKLHVCVQLLACFSLLIEGHLFLLLEKEKQGMYYKRSKGSLFVKKRKTYYDGFGGRIILRVRPIVRNA